MNDSKMPHVLNDETKERIEVEMHELSEGTHIESKYMGTAADRHDMTVLGRKQVLRVGGNQQQSTTGSIGDSLVGC